MYTMRVDVNRRTMNPYGILMNGKMKIKYNENFHRFEVRTENH